WLTVAQLVLLVLVPALVAAVPGALGSRIGGLTPAAVVAGAGAVATLVRGLTGRARRFAPLLGGVLFVLMLALAAIEFLALRPTGTTAYLWWLAVLVVSGLAYVVVSGEWWSMAGFYRARLRLAFATYRDKNEAEGFTSG